MPHMACARLVSERGFTETRIVAEADLDVLGHREAQLALGTLDGHGLAVNLRRDAGRNERRPSFRS